MSRRETAKVRPIVVVSDLHVGCGLSLMPKGGFTDDTGVHHSPSPLQEKLHSWWEEFWGWAEEETGGTYDVVVNGDLVDGVHHGSVYQWTQNHDVQRQAAVAVLSPVRNRAKKFLVTRGTESHVGQSGQNEEGIARELDAQKAPDGNHSHWQIFYRAGDCLIHFAHHAPVSMSPFSKSSGLQRELVYGYVHSGRWGDSPPDMYVRSHRHECSVVGEPSLRGMTWCWTTSPWQLQTPYIHRSPRGGAMPEVGGLIINFGDQGVWAKPWTRRLSRPEEVVS